MRQLVSEALASPHQSRAKASLVREVLRAHRYRMRLKSGDSLLMPMKVPHRWSVAQDSRCGAIHLYTPAG